MQSFKDAEGLDWTIQLDTRLVRDIRSELGVDLLRLDEKSMTLLVEDDEKLVDVISFICTGQIEKRELDAVSFAKAVIGGAIDDACDALVAELVFISRRSRGVIVAKAWEKVTEAQDKMTAKAMEVLESGVIEQKIDDALKKMSEQLGMP